MINAAGSSFNNKIGGSIIYSQYHNHSYVESIQILPLSCFFYHTQVHISMRPLDCTVQFSVINKQCATDTVSVSVSADISVSVSLSVSADTDFYIGR